MNESILFVIGLLAGIIIRNAIELIIILIKKIND